jgi:hypothetical protein
VRVARKGRENLLANVLSSPNALFAGGEKLCHEEGHGRSRGEQIAVQHVGVRLVEIIGNIACATDFVPRCLGSLIGGIVLANHIRRSFGVCVSDRHCKA